MKTTSSPLFTATLAAVLLTKAVALEAPADDAPPPPVQGRKQALPRFSLTAPSAKTNEKTDEKTAFLGVVSGEVPAALVDQLNLKNGEGVLIRSLAPDSPAARAGIAIHDVITKISGQTVGSPKEISAQISNHQPGESIKVELIHKGQPTTLDIALESRPAELANLERDAMASPDLNGLPKELADRVRDAIAGNVGALDFDAGAGVLPPQFDQAMRKLQLELQGAVGQMNNLPGRAKFQFSDGATIKIMDQQGKIEINTQDGSKELTVCDQNGNVTWRGPWDTAQDKAAAPAEVRKRVEGLHLESGSNGNGLRFQMRQAPALEDN